ncbi:MAG: cation transporting ATPase C-terminal domain-containing protein, partial [Woeseiaceae bacterium]
ELRHIFDNEIMRNGWIWAALVICLVLVLAAIYVPALSNVLVLIDPGAAGWFLILPASLVPLLTAPLVSALSRSFRTA